MNSFRFQDFFDGGRNIFVFVEDEPRSLFDDGDFAAKSANSKPM